MLFLLQLIPLIGASLILLTPSWQVAWIRSISLIFSLAAFLLSLVIYACFDNGTSEFQMCYIIDVGNFVGNTFNFSFHFGLDGISLMLVLLTTFLTPICLLAGWAIPSTMGITGHSLFKTHSLIFLAIESILLVAFTTTDLLVFYLFFEAVLIPMFYLVGLFGSKPRKIRAAFKMFLYTLTGSLPMLVAIFILYFHCGTTSFNVLAATDFGLNKQLILWPLMFISFAVKTPIVPFHGWLPETHSNAPTGGSIILAGLLLKLGTYGILRWLLPIFPAACIYYSPLVYIVSLIGILYVSLVTLRQIDLKKVIAYSSVVHMGVCILGLFAFNYYGLEGSVILMIGHGIVSPGLFLCIGLLYNRSKTRIIHYFSGLAQTMPLFSTALLILSMANLSLPVLSPSFSGEMLVFTGIFHVSKLVATLAALSMILCGAYVLFLYCRICFGITKDAYTKSYSDLNRREFAITVPFLFLSVLIGIFPTLILDPCHASIANLLLAY